MKMDYFEDDFFEDDFDEDFDDGFEMVEDNPINDGNDGSEIEDDSLIDDFTTEDAFYLGTMMGLAYEEGLEGERRRRKIEKETLEPDDIFRLDDEKDY